MTAVCSYGWPFVSVLSIYRIFVEFVHRMCHETSMVVINHFGTYLASFSSSAVSHYLVLCSKLEPLQQLESSRAASLCGNGVTKKNGLSLSLHSASFEEQCHCVL